MVIEIQSQIVVGAIGIELLQWMIQEVKRCEAELYVLRFGNLEILEKCEITVPIGRSFDVGPIEITTRAKTRGSKAARIEILARLKATARIAGQCRNQRHRIRSEVGSAADRTRVLCI